MPFSQIKWITFDVGGTLLFPNPSVGEIYAEVLSRHGHHRDPALLEQSFFRVLKEEVEKCVPAITPESEKERWRGIISRTFAELADLVDMSLLFDDLWDAFCESARWRMPDRTLDTLEALRSSGYRLAVLSNWDERLRALLQDVGLSVYFEEIFVSCELGCEKPDPRLFAMVEKRLAASGAEILHIGDSHHHDVLGATSRGWRAVHAFSGSGPENAGNIRISCFSQLLDLLPKRNSAL